MSEAASQRRFKVLLVEDNHDDVWLTKRAFAKMDAPVELFTASDGVDALAFLRQEPPYADVPRPDMILLDLNMPRMNGHELLVEVKQDENLASIPTIILSTSGDEVDVYKSFSEHASAYLTKPLYLQELAARTKCFLDFWLGGVTLLPSEEGKVRLERSAAAQVEQ
jgi:two-component system, chemotaxis family, response regulator Rcp1